MDRLLSVGRYPSGQREQTVNLPAYAYVGSNPSRPTMLLSMNSKDVIFPFDGIDFPIDPELPEFEFSSSGSGQKLFLLSTFQLDTGECLISNKLDLIHNDSFD